MPYLFCKQYKEAPASDISLTWRIISTEEVGKAASNLDASGYYRGWWASVSSPILSNDGIFIKGDISSRTLSVRFNVYIFVNFISSNEWKKYLNKMSQNLSDPGAWVNVCITIAAFMVDLPCTVRTVLRTPPQFLHDPWIQELLSNSILPVSYTKKPASN